MKKVNVCGVTYRIRRATEAQNSELVGSYGYCDYQAKTIVLNADNTEYQNKRTLRHELTHAFLDECGLGGYSNNETLVTFLEMQLPKLFALCKKLGALEEDSQ